jgi:hypothetical protein
LILFGIFYFLVFSYLLPLIYQSLETRAIFFKYLLNNIFDFTIFFRYIVIALNINTFYNYFNVLVFFIKKLKHLEIIKVSYLVVFS